MPPETPSVMSKGSKEAEAKSLLMSAWRERWTDVKWGINIRALMDSLESDGEFVADCILQQALGGPGPNALVLSYLMHSIYSQVISSSAILKSVSKYEQFHKPYCVTSLLDLLDEIKDRMILIDGEDGSECMDLALSLASIIHWLLTCMYSSLENLSDLSSTDFPPADAEDPKIVLKCRQLIEFFLTEPFLGGLIRCATLENDEMFQNIQKMSGEIAKFSAGHHHQDIAFITGLIEKIGSRRACCSCPKVLSLYDSIDTNLKLTGSPAIQIVLITAALFRSEEDVKNIASEFVVIKNLKGLKIAELYSEILHSTLAVLVDALGKSSELQMIGFTLFILPPMMKELDTMLNASNEDFAKGINLFLENDSVLRILDTKFSCSTLEILLIRFQKLNLIGEAEKKLILEKHPQDSLPTNNHCTSAKDLMKAELCLQEIFILLDSGNNDFSTKNQELIVETLYEMIENDADYILAAASCKKLIKELFVKLLIANHLSRQVTGEIGKASVIRAMIFDVTFLLLCSMAQRYGRKVFPDTETDSFFIDWYNDCMVEDNCAKNPDIIVSKCDQIKVDQLINQYLQGDAELKTSLVFWHELCHNAVGVVRDLLYSWESEAANFSDVKKLLDVFRLKVCSLPLCVAAWLCSHVQVSPEEKSGKAKYILNHFLNSVPTSNSFEEDHFKERFSMMSKILKNMIDTVQPTLPSSSLMPPLNCPIESKPISNLYKICLESMRSKGLIDVDIALSLKSLLELSGSHYFIQELVTEMLENQSSTHLLQWSNMLYGVFQINLHSCTTALLRVVIPSLLHYWDKDSNFVEPQINALVLLSVDCIIAYYYQAKLITDSDENDFEPSTKRRRICNTDNEDGIKLSHLNFMLQELYDEFDKILKVVSDARPQAVFVLRFLEEFSMKSSDLSLFSSLPNSVISNLMILVSDEITPELLLGWHSIKEKNGRKNCVMAICALKNIQTTNDNASYYEETTETSY